MTSSEIYYILEGSGNLIINEDIHIMLEKDDSVHMFHQIPSNLLKIQAQPLT